MQNIQPKNIGNNVKSSRNANSYQVKYDQTNSKGPSLLGIYDISINFRSINLQNLINSFFQSGFFFFKNIISEHYAIKNMNLNWF